MALRKNSKVELIKRVPLFALCSKRELGHVAAVADEVLLRTGRDLTRQGSPGREFFVIVEGEAEVRKNGRKVATLTSGDFFGEIALISNRPRTATVTATGPIRLLVVTDRAFRRVLERSPSIQAKVLEALAERLEADI